MRRPYPTPIRPYLAALSHDGTGRGQAAEHQQAHSDTADVSDLGDVGALRSSSGRSLVRCTCLGAGHRFGDDGGVLVRGLLPGEVTGVQDRQLAVR